MSLVLTRKDGEGVLIGENAYLTVQVPKGIRVRLIIDAPEDVRFIRGELLEKGHPAAGKILGETGENDNSSGPGTVVGGEEKGHRRE